MDRCDYFKHIDFDKAWDEEDWERFFLAQDRLLKDSRPGARALAAKDPSLSFRWVMRQFGMDPDDPTAVPADFATAEDEESRVHSEDASLHDLPIYLAAKSFVHRFFRFCDFNYGKALNKAYKSKAHRERQEILLGMMLHAAEIHKNVAAGHELGYAADAVKGNIARCKRALGRVDQCLGLLSRLPAKRLPAGEHARLFKETVRLRNGLLHWINYLRRRFTTRAI